MEELTDSSGGALDIAPVLRVFLKNMGVSWFEAANALNGSAASRMPKIDTALISASVSQLSNPNYDPAGP